MGDWIPLYTLQQVADAIGEPIERVKNMAKRYRLKPCMQICGLRLYDVRSYEIIRIGLSGVENCRKHIIERSKLLICEK